MGASTMLRGRRTRGGTVPTKDPTGQLGGRLRAHRLARKWRQEDLAEFANVDQATISAIELGRTLNPTYGTVAALVGALRLDVADGAELFVLAGHPAPGSLPPDDEFYRRAEAWVREQPKYANIYRALCQLNEATKREGILDLYRDHLAQSERLAGSEEMKDGTP